jgi:hypothetical protein
MPELKFRWLHSKREDASKLRLCINDFEDYIRYPECLSGDGSGIFFGKKLSYALNHFADMASEYPDFIDRKFDIFEINLLRKQSCESLEQEMQERFDRGFLAGMVLAYVWKLDINGLEGSVKKSIYIVSKIENVSESYIRKIWSQYKNVSHFFAGHYILHIMGKLAIPETKDPPTKECVQILDRHNEECDFLILFWSLHFYGYSTMRIEPRTKKPLLDKSDAWTIPDELFVLAHKVNGHMTPVVESVRWGMTEEENKALASYKSNLS